MRSLLPFVAVAWLGSAYAAPVLDEPMRESQRIVDKDLLTELAAEARAGAIVVSAEAGGGVRLVKDTRVLSRIGIERGTILLTIDRVPVTQARFVRMFVDACERGAARLRLRRDQGVFERVDRDTRTAGLRLLAQAARTPHVADGPRAVAARKNNRPIGINVYGIGPASALWKIGVGNGDTLTVVAGKPVLDEGALLAAIESASAAAVLTIEIVRYGQPLTLVIES